MSCNCTHKSDSEVVLGVANVHVDAVLLSKDTSSVAVSHAVTSSWTKDKYTVWDRFDARILLFPYANTVQGILKSNGAIVSTGELSVSSLVIQVSK